MMSEEARRLAFVNPDIEFNRQNRSHRAILSSNETLADGWLDAVKKNRPDGCLYGVGFGMSLAMAGAFQDFPKEIILCDVNLTAVLGGRMVIEMMRRCESFREMARLMRSDEGLKEIYTRVVSEQKAVDPHEEFRNLGQWDEDGEYGRLSEFLAERFESFLDRGEGVMADYPRVLERGSALDDLNGAWGAGATIYLALRRNYDRYHALAKTGQIQMTYADVTNIEWSKKVGRHLRKTGGRHLVYLSNVADYVCGSSAGFDRTEEAWTVLDTGKGEESIWVSTIYNNDYVLKATRGKPKYRAQWFGKEPGQPTRGNLVEEQLLEDDRTIGPLLLKNGVVITNVGGMGHGQMPVVGVDGGGPDEIGFRWHVSLGVAGRYGEGNLTTHVSLYGVGAQEEKKKVSDFMLETPDMETCLVRKDVDGHWELVAEVPLLARRPLVLNLPSWGLVEAKAVAMGRDEYGLYLVGKRNIG